MAWETVAKTDEFENRIVKTVIVADKPVMISKLEGKFYAVDALCTHMKGYLPAGKVEDGCVTCPVHRAQFDLKTGKMVKDVAGMIKTITGSGANDLKSYELEVEGEKIKIKI